MRRTFVVTKEGLPDAGKLDLMENLFMLNLMKSIAANYSHLHHYLLFSSCLEPLG